MITMIYECQCASCLASNEPPAERLIHHQMNVFLSRLDEQQRRWYVALESMKIGRGGDKRLSEISGMDVETIRRGRCEMENDLSSCSTERIRAVGGGQPAVEKKTRRSRRL